MNRCRDCGQEMDVINPKYTNGKYVEACIACASGMNDPDFEYEQEDNKK
jgi:hypothetical protein